MTTMTKKEKGKKKKKKKAVYWERVPVFTFVPTESTMSVIFLFGPTLLKAHSR